MNMPLKLRLLPVYCTIIFAGACKGPGNNKDAGIDNILNKPPFALLTDSIRQASPANAAGLYFRRGDLLSRNNFHEIAAEDYKRSWELMPDETTGFRYASTLSIIGRTDEAVKLLQDCIYRFPSNRSFSGLLGTIYMQSGEIREAIDLYDTLLRKDSTDFEAWYDKGLLLEKAKDTAGAIAALQKAYSIQPTSTYALELAHLYAERSNSLALSLCDAILQKDSSREFVDPLFIKGIYYSNTGQYAKAIAQFDSCIRRDWKFIDAYLEKGIALFRQKKYEQALGIFHMAITVSDTFPDGYYWMGRCYEALGNKEEAIRYYQQAAILDKDFTEAKEAIRRLK